jgi:hypothetical protein
VILYNALPLNTSIKMELVCQVALPLISLETQLQETQLQEKHVLSPVPVLNMLPSMAHALVNAPVLMLPKLKVAVAFVCIPAPLNNSFIRTAPALIVAQVHWWLLLKTLKNSAIILVLQANISMEIVVAWTSALLDIESESNQKIITVMSLALLMSITTPKTPSVLVHAQKKIQESGNESLSVIYLLLTILMPPMAPLIPPLLNSR